MLLTYRSNVGDGFEFEQIGGVQNINITSLILNENMTSLSCQNKSVQAGTSVLCYADIYDVHKNRVESKSFKNALRSYGVSTTGEVLDGEIEFVSAKKQFQVSFTGEKVGVISTTLEYRSFSGWVKLKANNKFTITPAEISANKIQIKCVAPENVEQRLNATLTRTMHI